MRSTLYQCRIRMCQFHLALTLERNMQTVQRSPSLVWDLKIT